MRGRKSRILCFFVLLFISSVASAAQRTIEFETREVTEADVTLSPDGQWLIFTMLGHLFRLPVTGGTAEQLTFGPYYDSDPVFSPDGKQIAFVSDRDGSESNIFLLELATSRVTQLTHEAWAARPAWSPDGRAIVYLSMVPAGSSLVPVVRHGIPGTVPAVVRRTTLSSGDTETLTSEPRIISSVFHLGDGQLGWAAVELAIEQGSPRAVTRIEVWRPEGRVSTLRTVAGYAGPVYVSPRGDGLYCRRIFPVLPWYTQRIEDFIFVPLDDGAERLLLSLSRPRGWTPKFAVTADNNTVYVGESSRLWRVSIHTGLRTPIPFLARVRMEIEEPVQPMQQVFLPPGETVTVRAILDPKLSPDGRMLAFSAAGYVWLQRLDGTPAQRLTSENGFESEPVFSPDGRLIAFVHTRDGRQEIRAINLRSRGVVLRHELPEEDTYEWQLAWTPAGDRVLFVEPDGSSYSVVTVSLGDGTKKKLTEVAWQVGSRPHLSPDGRWLYYTGPPGAGTFHRLGLDGSSKPDPLTQLSEQFSRGLLSPDGTWLGFRRNMEIWIARIDQEHPVRDSDIRQLSPEGGKSFDSTRDGSAVIYAVGNRVWQQSLATGEREEIPIQLEVRKAVPLPLLLHRVRVLDFRTGGFSPETSLFIEGGRIGWIGPESSRTIPEGTRILDAAGRFAIPGLFDMHLHTSYPADQYLALPYGITSLREPGGLIGWSNALLDRGEISGDPVPRLFFSGESFHGALLLRASTGLLIHDESEAREYVRQRKRSGAHLLKVYWPLPWSLHRVVADEARRQGIPVVGHGSNGVEEIVKSVTLGYATLEHSSIPTPSGDDVLQLLAAAGTRWTPTVSTRANGLLVTDEPERLEDPKLRALIPDVWVQRWLADRTLHVVGEHEARGRLAALLVSIKAAHERGVKLLIGTDRLPPSLHWELEYFVQAGISPLEVLRIAIQEAAEALGAQDDLGTLEPGKLADIVLLDKNPLEDIRNTQTIWRVIKGGWLFDPDELARRGEEQRRADSKNYKVAEFGYSASISQDGQVLVYVDSDADTGEDHLFLLDRRTGEKRQLTRPAASEEVGDGVWVSRDGKQIVYQWVRKEGTRDLRWMRLADGTGGVLYEGGERYRWVTPADWSPDGVHVAVWLTTADGVSQIGLVSVKKGSLRVIKTLALQRGDSWARFSPDGHRLAYTAELQPNEQRVYVLSLEDGTEFSVEGRGGDHFLIDWLPDGKGLLFARNEKGRASAWITDLSSGRSSPPARLTSVQLPDMESSIGITADGSLYYIRSSQTNDLYVVAYDPGSGKTGMPATLAGNLSFDSAAQWSPDGKKLAYFRGKGYAEDPFILVLRDAKGSAERVLDVGRLTRFGGHAIQPQWGADSRSVLVQGRDRDFTFPRKDSQLYRIDIASGEVRPVLQTLPVCTPDCVEWPVWSRDGRVIFMRWLPPGGGREPFKASIMALEIKSGKEKVIYQAKPTGRVSHLAASPHGQYLAFVEEQSDITSPERHFRRRSTIAIKRVPLMGGAAKELVRLPPPVLSGYGQPVFELAWTPDSKYVIYAPTTAGRTTFELWRVPRDGGEPEKLGIGIDGLLPYGLSVHPDGRRIAFTAGTPPRSEVWVLENFLPTPEDSQELSASDRRQWKIVFDSERDGHEEVYVMHPDGSNQQRLTHTEGEGGASWAPAWSADGKRIAFASNREGNLEVYVMDADGSNVQRLTYTPGKESGNPAWSPDGKRIAFESNRDGNWNIYVMDADGSNIQRLTHTNGEGKSSENPDWSPDGKRIAFDSNRDGKNEIYLMDADGPNVKRLTYTPGGSGGSEHPAWSPDGKRIAFDSTWGRTSQDWRDILGVYVMDADGSNLQRLTHLADEGKPSVTPVWSPDGKKMAFGSARDGKSKNWRDNFEIYVMDADGSIVQRLTFNQAWDGHPNW